MNSWCRQWSTTPPHLQHSYIPSWELYHRHKTLLGPCNSQCTPPPWDSIHFWCHLIQKDWSDLISINRYLHINADKLLVSEGFWILVWVGFGLMQVNSSCEELKLRNVLAKIKSRSPLAIIQQFSLSGYLLATPEAPKHCPFLPEAKSSSDDSRWVPRLHQTRVWIPKSLHLKQYRPWQRLNRLSCALASVVAFW